MQLIILFYFILSLQSMYNNQVNNWVRKLLVQQDLEGHEHLH